MSDPVREALHTLLRVGAVQRQWDPSQKLTEQAHAALAALDREREEARAATEFVCALLTNRPTWPNEWPQDVAAAAFVVQRLRTADGATAYLTGWRAGRDAAAITLGEYLARLDPRQGAAATVAVCVESVRALPDPEP